MQYLIYYLILFGWCFNESGFPRLSQSFPLFGADHPLHVQVCLIADHDDWDTADIQSFQVKELRFLSYCRCGFGCPESVVKAPEKQEEAFLQKGINIVVSLYNNSRYILLLQLRP